MRRLSTTTTRGDDDYRPVIGWRVVGVGGRGGGGRGGGGGSWGVAGDSLCKAVS